MAPVEESAGIGGEGLAIDSLDGKPGTAQGIGNLI
jgi:hypothetical protein